MNVDLLVTYRSKMMFFTAENSHHVSTPGTGTSSCADPAKPQNKVRNHQNQMVSGWMTLKVWLKETIQGFFASCFKSPLLLGVQMSFFCVQTINIHWFKSTVRKCLFSFVPQKISSLTPKWQITVLWGKQTKTKTNKQTPPNYLG